jgi:hypothetical protein
MVLFQSDSKDTTVGASRKELRKEALKDKAKQRDFEVGIGDIQRGMALGAQSQKGVAMIAQKKYRLMQQSIDRKIVGLTQPESGKVHA